MNTPPFLTVEQLAAALGVGKATVYGWTQRAGPDSVPRVRLGKRLGFDLADVVAWLKECRDPRLSLSARHRVRVLPAGRRRAPDRVSGSQQARKAVRTQGSANGPTAGAVEVPSDGV